MQTLLLALLAFLFFCVCGCHSQLLDQSLRQDDNCPLWFRYNKTLHQCHCPTGALLTCTGKDAIISSNYIATYDQNMKIITLSPNDCKLFNETTKPSGYVFLPRNLSRLNEYMCGPLNRKNYLCRDCKHGYGLAINTMTCTKECYKCIDIAKQVILYLIIEFAPLTLFYLFVLTFRVSFTSAPMTCFILYSQGIVFACYYSWDEPLLHEVVYTETGELRPISKLILVLYGTFNLDFFHYAVPPLCITTHLNPIHRHLLGYISAIYPLILIFLTWFCIKLHDNNFKPLVILWRPFHRCFVQLRKGWNTRNDLIDVFASFFLLSHCKIIIQAIVMLSTSRNFHYSLTEGNISETYVLYDDNTVPVRSPLYNILVAFAGLIILLIILPIIVLTFYPLKLFKRVISVCRLDGFALIVFVEKFQSCYREGLDGGKDMRIFSSLYFLLRVFESFGILILYDLADFERWFARGTLFSLTAVTIALCKPYKKSYMNITDALLLSHMALICHILSSNTENMFFVPFMQILILIPFVVFTVYTLIRIICEVTSYVLKVALSES